MKKTVYAWMAAAILLLSSCGAGTLGTILNQTGTAATDGQTLGNILQSVLGLTKVTKKDLVGSWTYFQPGCAFTSENLLAQAGGEVAAAEIRTKLQPYYQQAGVKSANTKVTFNEDGTFTATIAGKQFSGNYTFDEATAKITLQGMLLSINCYAKKNATGIGLLFESSKLLTLLQTLSALSGNVQLQGIGEIAKNYDGLRIGFDFK